ncbi:MAG TPA: hypothetical protein VFL67_02675 [Mycobacterium sp.]|nr:hypothetical protein [Mycobacterium sp.]
MHARVTTLRGPDLEAGVENYRANVVPYAKESGNGAILLVDRENSEALSITFWADAAAMRESEERADSLRANAAAAIGAGEPTIGRYEVAVFEM